MNPEVNIELFDGLRDNEEILFVWRKNPWTMFRSGLVIVGVTLAVFLSFLLFGASLITSATIAFWFITLAVVGGLAWYFWVQNAYVLTNQRLIDLQYTKLFHHSVSEIPMDIIQDVTYEKNGVIASIINFGDVTVQTASYTEVILETVTDPKAIQQTILKVAGHWRETHGISAA